MFAQTSTQLIYLLVALGGSLGAVLRFFIIQTFPPIAQFPYATILVNSLGCFGIGILWQNLQLIQGQDSLGKCFFVIGFLGGLTTFSSMALDFLQLQAQAKWSQSIFYLVANFILSFGALGLGVLAFKVSIPLIQRLMPFNPF